MLIQVQTLQNQQQINFQTLQNQQKINFNILSKENDLHILRVKIINPGNIIHSWYQGLPIKKKYDSTKKMPIFLSVEKMFYRQDTSMWSRFAQQVKLLHKFQKQGSKLPSTILLCRILLSVVLFFSYLIIRLLLLFWGGP